MLPRFKYFEQHIHKIETRIFSKIFQKIYKIMKTFTLFWQGV